MVGLSAVAGNENIFLTFSSSPRAFRSSGSSFGSTSRLFVLSEKIKNIDYTSLFKPLSSNIVTSGNNLITSGIEVFNGVFNIVLIFISSKTTSLDNKRPRSKVQY